MKASGGENRARSGAQTEEVPAMRNRTFSPFRTRESLYRHCRSTATRACPAVTATKAIGLRLTEKSVNNPARTSVVFQVAKGSKGGRRSRSCKVK
jgi:hypothetical protein